MSIVRTSKFSSRSFPRAGDHYASGDFGRCQAEAAAAQSDREAGPPKWLRNPGAGLALDDKQLAVVKKVSDYFNTLGDMKGAFVQIDIGRQAA